MAQTRPLTPPPPSSLEHSRMLPLLDLSAASSTSFSLQSPPSNPRDPRLSQGRPGITAMATAVHPELNMDMVFINRARRALSHTSLPTSPIEGARSPSSPSSYSPLIPATPTNTPAAMSPLSFDTRSPPASIAPANSPINKPDSGTHSPISPLESAVEFHPPDFLKLHHFHSPLLWPTAPPNSPEAFAIAGDMASDMAGEVHTGLGERLMALTAATSKTGFTDDEIKILRPDVPKAPDNEFYEVRAIQGKGYGCFAIKEIKRGSRILADDPLLVVPVYEYFLKDIQEVFEKLTPAQQALYFTLHSAHGQDPAVWPKRVHPEVPGRERSRITEQHNARVAKEPSLISIFQTNCMEMGKGAAVFPEAARFNHSCNPNACFTWNSAIYKETIHAIKDINKDEQITLSYCDGTHDKAIRAWQLKHYGFSCDCEACSGDDSDPDSFACQSEARRIRLTELNQDFRLTRGPFIEQGVRQEGFVHQLLEYAKLLNEEGSYSARLADVYIDLTLVCERAGDLKNAKICANKALRVKLDCQGADHPDVPKYRSVVKRVKAKLENQGLENGKMH